LQGKFVGDACHAYCMAKLNTNKGGYFSLPPHKLVKGSFHIKSIQNSFMENSIYLIVKKQVYVDSSLYFFIKSIENNPNVLGFGLLAEGISEFEFISPEDGEVAVVLASFDDEERTNMVIDDFRLYTHPDTTVATYTFDTDIEPWRNVLYKLPDDTLPIVAGIHSYDDSTHTLTVTQTLLDGRYGGIAARTVGGLEPYDYYQYQLEISSDDIIFDNTIEAALMLFDKEDYEHQGVFNSIPLAYMPISAWGTYTTPQVQTHSDGIVVMVYVQNAYGVGGGSFRIGSLEQQHSQIIASEGNATVTMPTYAYRYGFNGQERETEINPSVTSAEYWFYDGRLGRRWNLDPVKKPWQSDYACFSNSPIWKVDPDGDDDFFNSEGKLIRQTNTGSKIYVQTASGNVAYSQLPMNNMHNRQTLANITAYYAGQVGISGTVGVSNYPKDRNRKALAFTKGNKIYVNARVGGVGVTPLFDDYNNLKSALRHEKDHKDKGHGFNESSNFDHAEVYLTQIKDPTFSKTTADFKKGMAGSIASYLKDATYDEMKNGVGDFTALNNLVSEFNKQSKTTGYTFSIVQTQSGYSNPEGYQYEVYATPVKS
jgi:hypothetical protein